MAIIGRGSGASDVTKISRDVRTLINEMRSKLTFDDLLAIKGMGLAKTTEFMAAYELWRRQFQVSERPIVDSYEAAVAQLVDIREKNQEYVVCLTLDSVNRLIAKRIITIGTLTANLVHPREVFADAITDRAANIIVAHNHPSGNLEPSSADLVLTHRLKDAATLLGITHNDYLIVTKTDYASII